MRNTAPVSFDKSEKNNNKLIIIIEQVVDFLKIKSNAVIPKIKNNWLFLICEIYVTDSTCRG